MKVKVNNYYLVSNGTSSWGGYKNIVEALTYAEKEKEKHPNDTIKILRETTITRELAEIGTVKGGSERTDSVD